MLCLVSLLCVVLAAINHVDAAPVSTDTQAMVGAAILVFRELFKTTPENLFLDFLRFCSSFTNDAELECHF